MIGKLTGMPIPLNSFRGSDPYLPGDATDYKLDDQYRLSEVNHRRDGKTGKWFTVAMTAKRSLPCSPIWSFVTAVTHIVENG